MNFVAEPYAALVDHLLTGLTGGETREAHRFFTVNGGFGLTRSFVEVRAETIKVTGQHEQAFTVFVPGRDWNYGGNGKLRFAASNSDPEVPAEGAIWPDEGSDFYISYYHRQSHLAPLTDRNVGSLTRTLAEAFSRELAVLSKQLEKVYRSGFLETAEGRSLDRVVALLGLARKSGEFASGVARFYRSTPAGADVFIPAGTRVSTAVNPPVSFLSTADRRLRQGQLSVEAPIRAEVTGADGVVPAAGIVTINQAILGVNGVTNDAPTIFGGASETDEELRERAQTVLERVGRATPGAIVNAVAASSGLKENEIRLSESLQSRPGVIELFVARDPEADLALQVDDAILTNRPAGIRAEHNLEVALRPNEDGPVGEADNGEGGEALVPGGTDFRVSVRIRALVYPEDPRLTIGDQEEIRTNIRSDVGAYFNALAIGDPVVYNRLVARIMGIDGVRDLELDLSPSEVDPVSGRRNLRLGDGSLAVISDAASDIIVEFAGAPVFFDFEFTVSTAGGASLADAEIAIRDKLIQWIGAGPSTIDATVLLAVLQPDPTFTVLEADLQWTAEYEQAGLLLTEQTEVIELGTQERPVLRGLTVTRK